MYRNTDKSDITSSISLLEVPVASLIDRFGWRRNQAVWLSTAVIFLAGLPAALDLEILGSMDAVFGGLLLIFGGLLLSILLGWVVPRRFDEDLAKCATPKGIRRLLKFMLRWVSPIAIGFGLFVSVYDLVKPAST